MGVAASLTPAQRLLAPELLLFLLRMALVKEHAFLLEESLPFVAACRNAGKKLPHPHSAFHSRYKTW
jgi:hypothetical protein